MSIWFFEHYFEHLQDLIITVCKKDSDRCHRSCVYNIYINILLLSYGVFKIIRGTYIIVVHHHVVTVRDYYSLVMLK